MCALDVQPISKFLSHAHMQPHIAHVRTHNRNSFSKLPHSYLSENELITRVFFAPHIHMCALDVRPFQSSFRTHTCNHTSHKCEPTIATHFQNYHAHIYHIVASISPSRIEAHAGIFRSLMKGIFDPYIL